MAQPREICTTDRDKLRAWIPRGYHPALHLGGLLLGGFAVITVASATAFSALTPVDLIAVPLTLLIGSFLEYAAHRWLMHLRRSMLPIAWEAHTGRHHHYYLERTPTWDRPRDIWLILFSPQDVCVLAVVLAGPLWGLHFILSPAVWGLVVAVCALYFLVYEGLHLAFHVPEGHPVLLVPFVSGLRDHHLRHHRQGDTEVNFGVTSPLWDVILGTLERR